MEIEKLDKILFFQEIGRLINNMVVNIGVDNDGYALNDMHENNISEPWISLVDKCVREVRMKFKDNLHSIYIYGSVGRGNPKLNSSDLDFTVVLNSQITDKIKEGFEMINQELTAKYPFTREIGFDLGFIDEVLDENNIYSWGFWLKTSCYCIFGEDLSLKFPKFKPSKKVAKEINGDLEKWIESYTSKINKSQNADITKLYCQQIMKKIIRTGFSLIMEEENSWTGDLEISYELFSKHYPNREDQIKEVLNLIKTPISDKEKLIEILEKFNWMFFEINRKLN